MTESKIFIDGERPEVRHDPEWQVLPWRARCPCHVNAEDWFPTWREAFSVLAAHVSEAHL